MFTTAPLRPWENRPEGSPRPKTEQARGWAGNGGSARGDGRDFQDGPQLLEGAPEGGEIAPAEGGVGHPEPAAGIDQGATREGARRQGHGRAPEVGPGFAERAGGAHPGPAGDTHPGD